MALPVNVGKGWVTGTFMDSAGNLASGTITFSPTPVKILDASADIPTTILPQPVVATVTDGTFTQQLVASDDTDLNPHGWTYQVSFALKIGAKAVSIAAFPISVPEADIDSPVDLTLVSPVASSNGAVIIRGAGLPDPSTGTEGQAVVLDSSLVPVWGDVASSGGGGGPVDSSDITDATTVGKALITAADPAAARAELSLGTAATHATGDYDAAGAAAAAQTAAEAYTDTAVTGVVYGTRTVNGHALSADVVVSASDITTGTLPSSVIPTVAFTHYLGAVGSQAAMLALTGVPGDWCNRTDLGTTWQITGSDPTQLSNWTALSYPTAPVASVNGQTGAVSLAAADVGALASGGTAAAATKLATARAIDGQNFDGTAAVTVIAPGTHAATGKTTPVDADELPIVDSAASNVLKKVTFANLKAWFKSYYDTVVSTMTHKDLTDATNAFPTFNQSTTGNAATATKLATARAIAGHAFDGTAPVTITASDVSAQPSALGTTPTATAGVVVVAHGTSDAAITALDLPDGTVIVELSS